MRSKTVLATPCVTPGCACRRATAEVAGGPLCQGDGLHARRRRQKCGWMADGFHGRWACSGRVGVHAGGIGRPLGRRSAAYDALQRQRMARMVVGRGGGLAGMRSGAGRLGRSGGVIVELAHRAPRSNGLRWPFACSRRFGHDTSQILSKQLACRCGKASGGCRRRRVGDFQRGRICILVPRYGATQLVGVNVFAGPQRGQC